jgi:rubredoxin
MKVDISTVIKQDDFIQGFKNGFSQIEAKYGWICPKCGEYVFNFVIETFSHYNRDPAFRDTVITRSIEMPESWVCEDCKKRESLEDSPTD